MSGFRKNLYQVRVEKPVRPLTDSSRAGGKPAVRPRLGHYPCRLLPSVENQRRSTQQIRAKYRPAAVAINFYGYALGTH